MTGLNKCSKPIMNRIVFTKLEISAKTFCFWQSSPSRAASQVQHSVCYKK